LKLARCCGSSPEPHAARHIFHLAAEVACKTPTHIVTPPSFCIRDAVERFMPLLPKTIHDSKEGRHVIFWCFVPQPTLLCGVIRRLRNTLNTQVSTRVLPPSSHQCVLAYMVGFSSMPHLLRSDSTVTRRLRRQSCNGVQV
jgi:hypothetical protein